MFGLLWYFALVNFLLNFSVVLIGPMVLSFSSAAALGGVQMGLGVAMLAGSLLVGAWGGPKRQVAGVIGFIALAGVGLALAGLRPAIGLIGLGMFIMLFSIPIAQACSTAISQAKTEPSVQGRLFAVRALISQSMMPLAFLLAGPLADQVFNPLLQPGGALAGTILGQVLGVGAGRGVGLMFLGSGVVLVLTSLLAWANPRIRNLAEELPDVVIQAEPQRSEPAVQAEPVGS